MWPFQRKLNIVSFGDLESGCYLARIRRPFRELEKRGHKVAMQKEGFVDPDTDIVVFNNMLDAPLEFMISNFKRQGIKIVYDCDDAMDVHPHFLDNTKTIETCLYSFNYLLKNADLITTTTPDLAKYLGGKTNVPIAVLPNCLDPDEFPERKQFKKLRIGLAGSLSHAEDLLSMIDAIIALRKIYEFDFILFGFNTQRWEKWLKDCKGSQLGDIAEKLDAKLKEIDFICEDAVSAEEYPGKLAALGLDIGICPLLDNQFNRNKSCIKFAEYSLVSTCAIASNVIPFSKEPVMKSLNGSDGWYWKLASLIVNKTLREETAQKQRSWVEKNRNIKREAKRWEKLYRNLIN